MEALAVVCSTVSCQQLMTAQYVAAHIPLDVAQYRQDNLLNDANTHQVAYEQVFGFVTPPVEEKSHSRKAEG